MNYDPEAKVYPAGDAQYSIHDLLKSALDQEYFVRGMPRISDFHLKVGEAVRFRLDSELQSIPDGSPLTQEAAEGLIFPLLSPSQLERFQGDPTVDIDAGYELAEAGFNFRINAFRDRQGLAATIRLLPQSVPEVEEIGFPVEGLADDLLHLRQGLVVVSGITGSGKTTTIASLLNQMVKDRAARMITLEDPVEYLLQSGRSLVSQREAGLHIKTFAQGLKSALRENPDIIYVGEMRDIETTSLALTAAETGHLVFTTLHTRDAIGAITRIIDMFPAEKIKEVTNQLSLSLSYVLCQQLVPRADGEGRVVAMEVLKNITGLANMIRTGKWHQLYSMLETKASEGMVTMEESLLELHRQGFITREDAILHANRDDIVGRLPEVQPPRKKRW